MSKPVRWIFSVLGILLFVSGAIALYFYLQPKPPTPKPESVIAPEPALPIVATELEPQRVKEPEPEAKPIESQAPVQNPLPRLNESDKPVLQALAQRSLDKRLLSYLVSDEIVRKAVRAVSNLSEGQVVKEYRPLVSPSGQLSVSMIGMSNEQRRYELSTDNYSRYQDHLKLLAWISPESAAEFYMEYFPLLQQAYDELGLREPSFYVVTQEALDNILSDSAIPQYAPLVSPSVMYQFEQKEFESESGIQKLLWRMGKEQAQILRSWVEKFKSALSEPAVS